LKREREIGRDIPELARRLAHRCTFYTGTATEADEASSPRIPVEAGVSGDAAKRKFTRGPDGATREKHNVGCMAKGEEEGTADERRSVGRSGARLRALASERRSRAGQLQRKTGDDDDGEMLTGDDERAAHP
jgi:hypothetical protein